ncbi:MAG: DegT/DnrJ/EryC1/StrS family aminotransferase [Chloroflexota bacterium]
MATSLDQPALLGGRPVRTRPFPLWPVFDEREEKNLLDVLRSREWGTHGGGRLLPEFEQKFAAYQHAAHAVAVSNGSVALEAAFFAVDLHPGDEVITTPYTFIATTTAILRAGARPVYVDIDPETYQIDAGQIESAVTGRTRAIVPVHLGGCPADLDQILDVATRHGLVVVEDACQAWGAEWRGKRVGALGDAGTFSFQTSKNITAGEGGMVVTNRRDVFERCWSYRNVGRVPGGAWYQHEILGWNYRLTEFQAAILLPQLERLPEHTERRTVTARYLDERLAAIPGITPMRRDERVTQNAWHLYMFRYDPSGFHGLPRARFLEALHAEGIPASPGYKEPLSEVAAVQQAIRAMDRPDQKSWVPPALPLTARACASEAIWLSQNVLLGDREDAASIVAAIEKIQRYSADLVP